MLTQNPRSEERKLTESRKKLRWFVALSTLPLLGVLTAFGLVPQNEFELPLFQAEVREIELPEPVDKKSAGISFWRNERVQRGDTVADLLRRLDVEDAAASEYLRKAAEAQSFRKLAVGKEINAEIAADVGLIALRYPGDDGAEIVIEKRGDGFAARTVPALVEKRLFTRTGEIETSLYAATDAADLPDAAAMQLNEIFSGDINFHHDLRKGDQFTVVYEMLYSNGAPLNTGRILATEFINQGRAYRAVYFEAGDGRGDYYTPEGSSVRKTFLRSPLEFSRVSSGFSSSRFHPVLNKWRAHKGVDFAAPTGTRVKATADGVVSFVGWENGYGNVVKISHQGRYSTVYGHLSRHAKGLRRGQRVAQGEVIGYVGMTGVASGPHLHYEFKVDGKQHNPMRVALPEAKPVDAADRVAFEAKAGELIAHLELLRNTNLARLD